ncbi:hypothetical protein F5Y09DRAFT_77969 [Xylaria sp. FL1042]|nr:hypothetical protein F5Y09DRAFT_77969 [Xylaria sp. FL1042]
MKKKKGRAWEYESRRRVGFYGRGRGRVPVCPHSPRLPLMDQSDRCSFDLHPACNYLPPTTLPPYGGSTPGTALLLFLIIPFFFPSPVSCLWEGQFPCSTDVTQGHRPSERESSRCTYTAHLTQSPRRLSIAPRDCSSSGSHRISGPVLSHSFYASYQISRLTYLHLFNPPPHPITAMHPFFSST